MCKSMIYSKDSKASNLLAGFSDEKFIAALFIQSELMDKIELRRDNVIRLLTLAEYPKAKEIPDELEGMSMSSSLVELLCVTSLNLKDKKEQTDETDEMPKENPDVRP